MSPSTASAARRPGHEGVINLWQRGVPVYDVPIVTKTFLCLLALIAVGTVLGVTRLFGGSLQFTGMTDAYAWGVWKTFNVVALTALGSGALGVGVASWVFGRHRLHTVMRTALVTSLLFYGTGLLGLLTDVGRPWNFWNMALPWRWNTGSYLWEISLAMPLYVAIFLAYECGPIVVERLWYTGTPRVRAWLDRWHPRIRRLYPYAIAGAYVLPIVHQSSLGGLMTLAGDKVHPLWQTDLLPVLYLMQAFICGYGCVIVVLMASGLVWRRRLDTAVLGELANLLSWVTLAWIVVRFGDLAVRGVLPAAFAFDGWSRLFLLENLLVLVPAAVLRGTRARQVPRVVFLSALVACVGGVLYRFIPTTIAYDPGATFHYFPTVPELMIMFGLIALAVALFGVAVKTFAVLPAPLSSWYALVDHVRAHDRATRRDAHGNPVDD